MKVMFVLVKREEESSPETEGKGSPVGRGGQLEVAPTQGTAAGGRSRASRPWRLARDRLRR
jgi:hypothetical protein